jgi:hypothetical protein
MDCGYFAPSIGDCLDVGAFKLRLASAAFNDNSTTKAVGSRPTNSTV